MKRALAFLVAAAMVGGSLWWRSRDDDGGATTATGGPIRIVCAAELAEVCDEVDGEVEDAGATAQRLVEADRLDVDAWVVPAPWPEIVDARRRRAQRPALFDASGAPVVGRSRLAMAIWPERADALGCTEPSWRCVGDAVAKGWTAYRHPEWGDVKPVLPDPARTGTGLVVLGHVVSSFFGRTSLATVDFEDPAFDPWFAVLARTADTDRTPAEAMLRFGAARYDVAGTTDAEAAIVQRAASGRRPRLLYPAPMATADVVVAGPAAGRVRDEVAAALRAGGWTATEGQQAPSPGFLEALLGRWEEVRR